eukprot:12590216-Ditylum_brightwellii.AAC.1
MYKKLIENYLDTKKGMEGAPLSYVIRKDDASITNMTKLAVLKTSHERLIKGSEMSGTAYETDNGKGDTRIGRSKDEAYAAIKATTYTWETQNWGYEDYMTLHADNHWILSEAGEPVPPQKKVRDWLDGIDCTEMTARKALIRSNPKMLDDFIRASDYLASFVKKRPFNRRNLSSMYDNGGRSRGGRGHGGRGSWHRGGRGHGCGRGHGSRGNPIE